MSQKPLDLSQCRDLAPVMEAQRRWRSAHRRVQQFRAAHDTNTDVMRLALERQEEALVQIGRLDPEWEKMLRAEYGA